MLLVFVYGLVALCVILLIEVTAARFSRRRPQIGPTLVAGLLGLVYFVAMLYSAGVIGP